MRKFTAPCNYRMMRWWMWGGWCGAIMTMLAWTGSAHAGRYGLTARAAIVVDAETGQVLFERNPDEQLPPASTTKVLTAIVALESGRLGDTFQVSEQAACVEPTRMGLRARERVQLRDLLYAVLLRSANDASEVVAEGLAGSVEGFATRMNRRAASLGATRSHFENPHGLTAIGHVSTVRDLATIFRHGLRMPMFRSILGEHRAEIPVEGPKVRTVAVRSHNRLLSGWTYRVIGKTGYTRAARRCFVGAASNGSREVIIALLGASDLWGDARELIEFGLGDTPEPAVQTAAIPRPTPREDAPALVAPVEPDAPSARGDRARSVEALREQRAAALRALRDRGRARVTAENERQRGRKVETRWVRVGKGRRSKLVKVVKVVPAKSKRSKTVQVASSRAPRGTAAPKSTSGRARPEVAEGDDGDLASAKPAGTFAVKLGPFRSTRDAESTRTRLAKSGYQASVSGKTLSLGRFATHERAASFCARLKRSGFSATIVGAN